MLLFDAAALTAPAEADGARVDSAQERERQQEAEVRRTAQAILVNHLARPAQTEPATYSWGDQAMLDLNRATLMDWSMPGCDVETASFADAIFFGTTTMASSTFRGALDLSRSRFYGPVDLADSQLHSAASLSGAEFFGDVSMARCEFGGIAALANIKVHGSADFSDSSFQQPANLEHTTFADRAEFRRTHFHGKINIMGSDFGGYADFEEAMFHDRVEIGAALFRGGASFHDAHFYLDTYFARTKFKQVAYLGACFDGHANFGEMEFCEEVNLSKATFGAGLDLREAQFLGPFVATETKFPDRWNCPDRYSLTRRTSTWQCSPTPYHCGVLASTVQLFSREPGSVPPSTWQKRRSLSSAASPTPSSSSHPSLTAQEPNPFTPIVCALPERQTIKD